MVKGPGRGDAASIDRRACGILVVADVWEQMMRVILIAVTVLVLIGVAVPIANVMAPTGNALLVICREYGKMLAGRDYNSVKAWMCEASIGGM